MAISSGLISEDRLLNHYTRDMEHFFKTKYRENLNQLKRMQQDPSIDPTEKIKNFRLISWKTFQLRFMIHLYIHILGGNRRFISSCYIHHNVFQLDDFLTQDRRQKHLVALQRHENTLKRLLERIAEKIYSKANYNIYIFYNGVF